MATPKATNDPFPPKTRNSPDNNLFGHVSAKPMDLTKLCKFHVFPGFKDPFPCPSDEKSSASQILANPSTCTQLAL